MGATNISQGVLPHPPSGLCHQLPHKLLIWGGVGLQMRQPPRRLAYDRCGIGRLAFVTEAVGEFDCPVCQSVAQAPGISQHHAPGPDFAVARERHPNGRMDARRGGMSGTGGIGDNILLELNPPESHRFRRAVALVNVEIRSIHEPE